MPNPPHPLGWERVGVYHGSGIYDVATGWMILSKQSDLRQGRARQRMVLPPRLGVIVSPSLNSRMGWQGSRTARATGYR